MTSLRFGRRRSDCLIGRGKMSRSLFSSQFEETDSALTANTHPRHFFSTSTDTRAPNATFNDLSEGAAGALFGSRASDGAHDADRPQLGVVRALHAYARVQFEVEVVDDLRRDFFARRQHRNAGRIGRDHLGADASRAGLEANELRR